MSLLRLISRKIANKEISVLELAQHYLIRAKAEKFNIFLTINEDELLKSAKGIDDSVDSQDQSSLLRGIPFAIKDNIVTKGLRTTCASKILEDYIPPYDATVISRLKRAGGIVLGKVNLDEFGMGGSNENSAFGATLNPIDPTRVPGGSSGGSAAAVRAGICPASLGSDTGGSVRLPASYTGVFGLKPTYGLVSRYGLVAYASSLDQIGPIATCAEDAAHVLSEIAGRDPFDWEQDATLSSEPRTNYLTEMEGVSRQKWKIGLPREYFVKGALQPELAKILEEARAALEKNGHQFIEISLPHTSASLAAYYIIAVCEASSNLSRYDGVRFGARASAHSLSEMYEKTRSLFGPEVKRRILLGTFALSEGYFDAYFRKACQVRTLVKSDFQNAFQSCDLMMSAVAPTSAYRVGEKSSDPLKMYLNDILTIPANLAGLPAASIPGGRDASGLPLGIQFIAPHFQEARLLAVGKQLEESFYKEEFDHGF